jgi:hypothetical protein
MDTNTRRALLALLALILIVTLGLSITTYAIILPQHSQVDELAEQAIVASRRAEYRICVRQMIVRAILDTEAGNDEARLPVYDCTPNLHGRPARRLAARQAALFEAHVHATPENQLP